MTAIPSNGYSRSTTSSRPLQDDDSPVRLITHSRDGDTDNVSHLSTLLPTTIWSGWGNSGQRGSSELFLLGRRRKWTIYVMTRSMSWGVEDTTASTLGLFATFFRIWDSTTAFFFVGDTGHWSLRYSVVFSSGWSLASPTWADVDCFRSSHTEDLCARLVHYQHVFWGR